MEKSGEKLSIYNLIILDESGSMQPVRKQTISGCNETINVIKAAQKEFSETQKHYASIYAFQKGGGVPSRYIIKNVPAEAVEHITEHDYEPYGNTNLNDAVGATLTELKSSCKKEQAAIGSVTIITDGYENASEEYTTAQVARMIEELKELGWSFNFIGANIDVVKTAKSYNIDNHLEFMQDEAGTEKMFAREHHSRMNYYGRVHCLLGALDLSSPEDLKKVAEDYFDEEEDLPW